MFGALFGDIIGSYYEHHCTKNYNFELMRESSFTDDSVMTAAVCRAILTNPANISKDEQKERAKQYAAFYKQFYSFFPDAGFGQMFSSWAKNPVLSKQASYGNGAAMRAVPIGYAYSSLEQVLLQARASCLYTHSNKEAIIGAQTVAAAVYMANNGSGKSEIKDYIEKSFGYDLSIKLSDIAADYLFDSRTSYSVPPSVIAFLESEDYESAVRLAVSLGGDADTMACIAGGIAEAFYHKIPREIKTFCYNRLASTIKLTANEFCARYIKIQTEFA